MQISLNGEKKEIKAKLIVDLLTSLKLHKDMVAIEINDEIVHRQDFDKTRIHNNDKIEIITVVGGG